MINKLSKSKQLATDTMNVEFGLRECVEDGMFIDAKITSSTLRNSGSYIEVEVLLREHGEIVTKQIAFSVVNDVIYSAIPLSALCDVDIIAYLEKSVSLLQGLLDAKKYQPLSDEDGLKIFEESEYLWVLEYKIRELKMQKKHRALEHGNE